MDQWEQATWLLILLCSFLFLNSSTTPIFIVSFPQKMIKKESQAVCWPKGTWILGPKVMKIRRLWFPSEQEVKRPPAVVPTGLCLQQLSHSLQGTRFLLTSASISGFLLRFHWGRKDYYYYFTSEKCFIFPKAKTSSMRCPLSSLSFVLSLPILLPSSLIRPLPLTSSIATST